MRESSETGGQPLGQEPDVSVWLTVVKAGEDLIHKGYGYDGQQVSDLTSPEPPHWVLGEVGGHVAGIVADHALVHILVRPLSKVGQKVWRDTCETWKDNRDVIENNRDDFRKVIEEFHELIEKIRGLLGLDRDAQELPDVQEPIWDPKPHPSLGDEHAGGTFEYAGHDEAYAEVTLAALLAAE